MYEYFFLLTQKSYNHFMTSYNKPKSGPIDPEEAAKYTALFYSAQRFGRHCEGSMIIQVIIDSAPEYYNINDESSPQKLRFIKLLDLSDNATWEDIQAYNDPMILIKIESPTLLEESGLTIITLIGDLLHFTKDDKLAFFTLDDSEENSKKEENDSYGQTASAE